MPCDNVCILAGSFVLQKANEYVAESCFTFLLSFSSWMYLQAYSSGRGDSCSGFGGMLEIGNDVSVNPNLDSCWFTLAYNSNLIPLILHEVIDTIGIVVYPVLSPGTVNSSYLATFFIIERNLMTLTVGPDSQENSAIERPINFCFQG